MPQVWPRQRQWRRQRLPVGFHSAPIGAEKKKIPDKAIGQKTFCSAGAPKRDVPRDPSGAVDQSRLGKVERDYQGSPALPGRPPPLPCITTGPVATHTEICLPTYLPKPKNEKRALLLGWSLMLPVVSPRDAGLCFLFCVCRSSPDRSGRRAGSFPGGSSAWNWEVPALSALVF